MVKCPQCNAETRKLEASVYVCKECDSIPYDFGLTRLLEEIGINRRIIEKIEKHIMANKVASAIKGRK